MAPVELDRAIVDYLGEAKAILNVGCGDGRLVNLLAQEMRRRTVGLDISPSGFAQAKNEAARAGLRGLVECVWSDARIS